MRAGPACPAGAAATAATFRQLPDRPFRLTFLPPPLPPPQASWDKAEDKPAVVLTATAALTSLYFASSIVNTIDRIPLVSGLLELVSRRPLGWLGAPGAS